MAHLGTLSKVLSACVIGLHARSGSEFNFDYICRKELPYRDRLNW